MTDTSPRRTAAAAIALGLPDLLESLSAAEQSVARSRMAETAARTNVNEVLDVLIDLGYIGRGNEADLAGDADTIRTLANALNNRWRERRPARPGTEDAQTP